MYCQCQYCRGKVVNADGSNPCKKRVQTPPPPPPPRVVVNHKTQKERLEESAIRYGMKRNFQLGVLSGAGAVVVGYYLGQFLFSIGI